MPGTSYERIGPRWHGNGQQYENWAAWRADGNIRAVFTVSSVPLDGGWDVVEAQACR